MRKIEQEMLQAFAEHRQHWKSSNTQIDTITGDHTKLIIVHLSGNIIACFDTQTHTLHFTDATWPTRTTISRLNTLLSLAPYCISISFDRRSPYINSPLQRLFMQSGCWYSIALRQELTNPLCLHQITDSRHDFLSTYRWNDDHFVTEASARPRLPALVC